MKILHTSDWHLGHQLFDFERIEEFSDFFHQLFAIIESENPEVMVISGDIFHHSYPNNFWQRYFNDQLLNIHQHFPKLKIVAIAGNHDSSNRLEISAKLWNFANVNIIGNVHIMDGKIDYERHIIEINNSQNELVGYIIAIPYLNSYNFPSLENNTPREERLNFFTNHLQQIVNERNTDNLPVIMLAHIAVTDSDTTGHNMERGGMEFYDVGKLGTDYDYLALGHIHCPQTFNNGHARYCGTPIPISFDEKYEHSITMVTLEHKGEQPIINPIKIKNPIPLKVFPKDAVEFDEAFQLLEDFDKEEKMYLQLHVKLKDVPPQYCMEHATKYFSSNLPNVRFCVYKWEKEKQISSDEKVCFNIEQLQNDSPTNVAKNYYAEKFNSEMSPEMVKMLDSVIKEVASKE